MGEAPRKNLISLWMGPDDAGHSLIAHGTRVTSFGDSVAAVAGAVIRMHCASATIEPGRVNAHTHIYSGLVPLDMPPPDPPPTDFRQILERIWWRLDRALDADTLRAAARYYVAEALLAGTTTLVDHHESPSFIEGSLDLLADVCQELGMRAILCYGATERNGGRTEALRGLAECRRFIQSNRRPLVRGVVGLHASFTVSDETIQAAGELCQELGTVMHVHLAEDRADVEDAQHRGYAGPLERLGALGALPRGSILAHGVHLDADQVRHARELGCWLVQNPRSNRGNGVGYPQALGESPRVALGTDGYPADMRAESSVLREEAVKASESPGAIEGRTSAGAVLVGECFGLDIGQLAADTVADAVALGDGSIRHLLIDGRMVIHEGQLLSGDIDAIRTEAREAASRLWRAMQEL